MKQKIISEIGRSQRLSLVNLLKKSEGMTVSELSERLGMSYMGVKQHCLGLEKEGYLDTWRRPKVVGVGRPELVYRLTAKAHDLYPMESNALVIDLLGAAQELFGGVAAEKLLYASFRKRVEYYERKVKGEDVVKRAKMLAKAREQEGYLCDVNEEGMELLLIEYHSPILELLEAYPLVGRLEQELFEQVLGVRVQRTLERISGLYRCTFVVGTGLGQNKVVTQPKPEPQKTKKFKKAKDVAVPAVSKEEPKEEPKEEFQEEPKEEFQETDVVPVEEESPWEPEEEFGMESEVEEESPFDVEHVLEENPEEWEEETVSREEPQAGRELAEEQSSFEEQSQSEPEAVTEVEEVEDVEDVKIHENEPPAPPEKSDFVLEPEQPSVEKTKRKSKKASDEDQMMLF